MVAVAAEPGAPRRINNWVVSHLTERFRIFPKGKDNKTVVVWRHNVFLRLLCVKSGDTIVFKYFLHQKQYLWRDSREKQLVVESDVLKEVARMLGVGVKTATEVVSAAKYNAVIPHGELVS